MYFNVEVSKYALPEEITTNIRNVPIQNFSKINEKDFVIGIAASGTTPYVVGGIKSCNNKGCLLYTSDAADE